MKTRTMKSILSLVLSLTLAMGLMTSTVFATDIEEPEPDPEATEEDIFEDEEMPEITEEETEPAVEQPDEEEVEAVPADEDEGEEEDPGIQLFAATDENQTLKVEQKEQGTIGDNVSFTYHLYQILEAAETIQKMGDITESEPGANLDYVICDADGNETSSDTTDEKGTFALHVGETAEFTLEAETSWYVYQDTPDAYPLISVDAGGEYADVVDRTNGVVYYGQIEPESEQPTVSVSVSTNIDGNEKTYDGGSVTLTADVSYSPDTATVSYQWYKDGEEISGETKNTLTLDGNVSDSGTYKCVVTAESNDGTATAEAGVTVTINKAEQDISYEQSTVTKIDYDEDFTIELTETVVVGEITYASGDESVATIDPDTGEVHIVGPGYTTITATAKETDNYEEASASYVLTVNTDEIVWEIDVDNERVTWDEDSGEWVDDLTYTGNSLKLEMAITLTEEEQDGLVEITYQWYRYNSETQDFDEIEGATEDAYTLEGEDVNAGDYIYMCMAVVTYKNGYEHTVYGPIEVIIEKVAQEISYEVTEIEKTTADEPFTNKLTETSISPEEGSEITYTSSDETVATVDENGLVTILSDGEVTITATAVETTNYAEATASYTIVVTEFYNVKYAVRIYGIQHDMDEDGNLLGLTFGPATGESYIESYNAHLTEEQYDAGEGICLHWMSWDEIIEQSKEDPTAFEACLKNGCTHSVNITLNDTLNSEYTYTGQMDNGDGTGALSSWSIKLNYLTWNSINDNTGYWPGSRIRATLNGADIYTNSSVAGTDTLDESTCLFSCFPASLQLAIVPKVVETGSGYTSYDRLWMFSQNELWGYEAANEGTQYEYLSGLDVDSDNCSALISYNEKGWTQQWWTRSRYWNVGAYFVYYTDGTIQNATCTSQEGLAPGFCIE